MTNDRRPNDTLCTENTCFALQVKQVKIREINDQSKKALLASSDSVANVMTDNLNEKVREVFNAQKKLEKEAKGLQTNTAHFAKQSQQWLDMIKTFNSSLKVCI